MKRTHNDGASLRKPAGISSFARVIRQYKANAKRRGILFTLTDSEMRTLTSQICVYCGVEPRQVMCDKDANGPYIYNGVDRIDSSIGYILSNCTTACKFCNKAKTNMSVIDWLEWLNRIAAFKRSL